MIRQAAAHPGSSSVDLPGRRDPARSAVGSEEAALAELPGGLGPLHRVEGGSFGVALRRDALLHLQRSHGNQHVLRLLGGTPLVQRCGGVVHAGCPCASGSSATMEEDPSGGAPETTLQRLTETEKAEDLKSPRYAGMPRLESAFDNSPAIHQGEKGEGVKAIQQGLIDDGFPMPVSTKKTGSPDGFFGGETLQAVRGFQKKHGLLDNGVPDGVVGRRTMGKLDELAGSGGGAQRIGPQTSDLEIRGKSGFAAGAPSVIFFDKDDAAFFDEDERAKAKTAATPKDQDLKLTGTASEDESATLATTRVGTVSVELVKSGHQVAHITPHPDLAAGRGNRDYRGARRVEITTGIKPPAGPKCQNDDGTDVPPRGPCDQEIEAKLTAAQAQADALLGGAITALSPPSKPETLAALDVTFGGNKTGAGKASVPVVLLQLGRIRQHVKNLSNAKAHNCGNLCDSSCSAGAGAYNNGVGGAAVMTLCPSFKDATGNLPAAILIHEGAHGTAGLTTQDFAYASERAIDFLTPQQALRNSDSYVNFALRISTGATIDKPPQDTLQGMDTSPADQDAAKRTLARVEKLIQFSSQDIASLYDALQQAQKKGSWVHKDVPGFGKPLMDKVAPRFALTPTSKPPTNRDRFAVAAISDRYKLMIDSLYGVPHTLSRDPAKPTSWDAGPGTTVTLGADFFAADPQRRIDIMLTELVKATPQISAGMVPEYVALTHDIEKLFHS